MSTGLVSAADFTKSVSDLHRISLDVSILGGAVAGMSEDVMLYPLDTLKTRLQSQLGFWKSGGFQDIYKGVGFSSSMTPITSGIFFGTYVTVKNVLAGMNEDQHSYPFIHMFSSSVAQVVASVVGVPTEVIKQRRQTSKENVSCIRIAKLAIEHEGVLGLYRGFASTILRDVPFVMVELPFWEWMRTKWKCKVKRELTVVEATTCGAIACAVATVLTTPFDVVQTHIILANNTANNLHSAPNILSQVKNIYRQHGILKLFAGFVPRLSMGLVGGGIFLGVFDLCCKYTSMI